jgi:hypothetical protein
MINQNSYLNKASRFLEAVNSGRLLIVVTQKRLHSSVS